MPEKDKERKQFIASNVNDVDWAAISLTPPENRHPSTMPEITQDSFVSDRDMMKISVSKADAKSGYGSVDYSELKDNVTEVRVGEVRAHKTVFTALHFDVGKDKPIEGDSNAQDNKTQLQETAKAAAHYLKTHPKAHIEIQGYTDTLSGKDGNFDNAALSKRRNENTVAELKAEIKKYGDFSERITVGEAYGKVGAQRSQTGDQTESKENRRTEIVGVEPDRKAMYTVYNTSDAKKDIKFDFKSGAETAASFTSMVDGVAKTYQTTAETPETPAKIIIDPNKKGGVQNITVDITDVKNVAFSVDTNEQVSYKTKGNHLEVWSGDKQVANVTINVKDPNQPNAFLKDVKLNKEDVTVTASDNLGNDSNTPAIERTPRLEATYAMMKAADTDGKAGLSQKEIEAALVKVNKTIELEKNFQEKEFNSELKGKKDGQGNEYKKDASRVIEDAKYYTSGEGKNSELGKVLNGADGKVDGTKDGNITFKELDNKIKLDENFKKALVGLMGASGGENVSVTQQVVSSLAVAKVEASQGAGKGA